MSISASDVARLGPAARQQILAKLAVDQVRDAAKKAKYRNQPDRRGKLRFGSKKEARRYDELMLMLQAGRIRGLKLQPQFTLQEAYTTPEGERVRAIRYVADFAYERPTEPDCTGSVYWLTVVEDVKSAGTRTEKYKLKRKLFREKFGFDIIEA